MKKYYVLYPQAVELKALGIDEPCNAHYRDPESLISLAEGIAGVKYSWINAPDAILAPLKTQVFTWFRDNFNMDGYPERCGQGYSYQIYINFKTAENESIPSKGHWATYEEAEMACINKLIELLKEKNSNGKHL